MPMIAQGRRAHDCTGSPCPRVAVPMMIRVAEPLGRRAHVDGGSCAHDCTGLLCPCLIRVAVPMGAAMEIHENLLDSPGNRFYCKVVFDYFSTPSC